MFIRSFSTTQSLLLTIKKPLFTSIFILIFLFNLSSNSFAENRWKSFNFFDHSGGINDGFADLEIADNEFTDLQNVVLTTGGNIKTRSGYAKVNSTAVDTDADCTGLFYYKLVAGTQYLVSIWDSDKIYKMDYSGGDPDGTWDDITGSLSFAAGTNNLASFAIGEDILIIEDGISTTAPYKWTGSGNAAALGGSPPNATMVAFHKRMGFAAGNSANPSTLYFSDVGNIENWSTALSGNLNIETNDGSIIRAIVPGFDALYIWKDHSIWRLSGEDKDTFVLQRMVSDVGTLSPKVVRLGNDFIFISEKNDIMLYDGGVKIVNISHKIQGTMNNLNVLRLYYTSGILYDDDIFLSVTATGSSANNRVLVFDTFNQAWTRFAGISANTMAIAEDSNGKEMIIFGDYSGFVYKYPSGTNDAGTAINTYAITKQHRFPELTPEKTLRLFRVFANQQGNYNLVTEIRSDYSGVGTATNVSLLGSTSLYGTAKYGTDLYGGQNLIIGRIEPTQRGVNFFQFKFSNENSSEPWELKGYQCFLEESERL